MVEVKVIDDESVTTMFIKALKARDLYKSLRRKAPMSYVAMMAKENGYAEEGIRRG